MRFPNPAGPPASEQRLSSPVDGKVVAEGGAVLQPGFRHMSIASDRLPKAAARRPRTSTSKLRPSRPQSAASKARKALGARVEEKVAVDLDRFEVVDEAGVEERPGRRGVAPRRGTRGALARGKAPARRGTARGAPGKRLLAHEAHIRALAVWSILGGLLLVGLGLFLFTVLSAAEAQIAAARADALAQGWDPGPTVAGPAALKPIVLAIAALGLLYGGCGVGLWSYAPWARMGALAAVGLGVLLDVGQIVLAGGNPGAMLKLAISGGWAAAVAWALLGDKGTRIFSRGYAQVVARDRRASVAWWASPFFLVPLLLFVLAVGAAFMLGLAAALAMGGR